MGKLLKVELIETNRLTVMKEWLKEYEKIWQIIIDMQV